ncbi:hypothetical protein V8C86DRAFT_943111 [Haematococcus lacustris]
MRRQQAAMALANVWGVRHELRRAGHHSWVGLASGARMFSAAQPDPEPVESAAEDATSEAASLRGLLAPFQTGHQAPAASGGAGGPSSGPSSRPLRFSDLPATPQLMESFTSSKNPGAPLLDIPSWLDLHFPSLAVRPRSGFYDWLTWMAQHLPRDQQRLYLALDQHMGHEPSRLRLMRKAQSWPAFGTGSIAEQLWAYLQSSHSRK